MPGLCVSVNGHRNRIGTRRNFQATSIFSYVRDTMPTTAPGSLSNSEVYSVMVYILASANIISRDMVLDASNVATIQMPNKDGFVADSRPDVFATQDSK